MEHSYETNHYFHNKMIDFHLDSLQLVGKCFSMHNINTFSNACLFIQQLPYKRIPIVDRELNTLIESVFQLQCGTCSSKHAVLAQLALENNHPEIELCIGIYLMSAKTNPQVEPILSATGLTEIPDAHAYLRIGKERLDFTSKHIQIKTIEPFIVREQRCDPVQMTDWKPMIHKNYLSSWLKRKQLPYSENELWEIREACIRSLEN
jgi:hypothetical protein